MPTAWRSAATSRSLFVAETGKYRVWKIDVAANDLTSARALAAGELLFDNLPGYPDNLMRGQGGSIWLGFSGPRSPDVDAMAGKPFLRELTLRLPRALWPLPKRLRPRDGVHRRRPRWWPTCRTLRAPTRETTGLTETADRLYVQNLHLHVLGWMAR